MRLSGFVKKAHFLSVDIVLGALAISVLSARLFKASPGWAWWVSLGLSVWILYLGDHMVDAFRHRKQVSREIHRFLWSNRRVLFWSLGVALAANAMIILNYLERDLLVGVLVLAGVVLFYYSTRSMFRKRRHFFIPGEFLVLTIYLAGTWLGPFISRTVPLQPEQGVVLAMNACVIFMNLCIISLYDVQSDTRLGLHSITNSLGIMPTRNIIVAVGLLVLLLGAMQFMVYDTSRISQLALILGGMAVILLLVVLLPSYFRKNELYRIISDVVLLLGFLALLVNG